MTRIQPSLLYRTEISVRVDCRFVNSTVCNRHQLQRSSLFLYIVPRLAINAMLTNPILRVRPFQRDPECPRGRTKYASDKG